MALVSKMHPTVSPEASLISAAMKQLIDVFIDWITFDIHWKMFL